MNLKFLLAFCLVLVASPAFAQSLDLVPMPVSLKAQPGKFLKLSTEIPVAAPETWRAHLEIVDGHVHRITDGKYRFDFVAGDEAEIQVLKSDGLSPEDYELIITESQVQLKASSLKGLARGTATFLQLLGGMKDGGLPLVKIEDGPNVNYRNFMIDMGRNPHSFELLKETVDLLWYYKVDSVQLHLTDDQRFAWPSKAFPKLWDGKITSDQFRELEAYAVERGVTIIPEFEVPGHSGILRSLYPEVFGKTGTELATSEAAWNGITTILDEMMEVFQSTPYIHVGGDEAFGVPEEAQRDLINKLNRYLKSKGRKTVVWEGPRPGEGENKVDTDVIHINWRTINYPADQMLRDGYQVVNAAWDPLYIVDHYPRINFTMTSPQHIYETLSLTRFKHVNPQIRTFAKPIIVEPSDRLIGFCMPWWEGREENFFSQNEPRLIAFAEVAWNPKIERDYEEFSKRVSTTEAIRQAAFYPVSVSASDLVIPDDNVFHGETAVRLASTSVEKTSEIRYTLDGSKPQKSSEPYVGPISIDDSTTVRAAAFVAGKQTGHGIRRKFVCVTPVQNLAIGKPVTSSVSSAAPFSVERLTDGGIGNLEFYLGYPAMPKPIDVTVDLEQPTRLNRIVVYSYSYGGSAEKYKVEVSVDGKSFEEVGLYQERPKNPKRTTKDSAVPVEHVFSDRDVRYIRVVTKGNHGYVFDAFSKLVEIQAFGASDDADQADSKTDDIKPVAADYRRLAFYPERWEKAELDFGMQAWEGEHVVFLTRSDEFDVKQMAAFVKRLDAGWQVYSDLIGKQPRQTRTMFGKPVICAIPKPDLSCGYGCGFVGATGIEVAGFYNNDWPRFQKQPDSFQHYYFYEMGRNFFVFGDRNSLFTTGYAVFMRYVCMDRLKCKDLDLRTRQTIEGCEQIYADSKLGFFEAFTNLGEGEKSDRLIGPGGRKVRPSDQPVMYASAMLKLRRDFGGDEWVKKFFHTLRTCKPAKARNIESAQTQVFNWLVCASIAAEQDLTPVFADRWRMPISDKQRSLMGQTDWTAEAIDVAQLVTELVTN